jgi:hypothetical protein
MRRNKLRQQYSLTEEQYDEMNARQNGLCAICGKPETRQHKRSSSPDRLSVDHDHATGKNRELLCFQCNLLIGYAHDDAEVLERAAAYLKKHKT